METCPLHPQMREDFSHMGDKIGEIKESIGEIRGRQDLQILALDEIKTGIKELTTNGNTMKIDHAIEETKLKPIFWFIALLVTIIATGIVGELIHHIWK
jgi:hypothetical protein